MPILHMKHLIQNATRTNIAHIPDHYGYESMLKLRFCDKNAFCYKWDLNPQPSDSCLLTVALPSFLGIASL